MVSLGKYNKAGDLTVSSVLHRPQLANDDPYPHYHLLIWYIELIDNHFGGSSYCNISGLYMEAQRIHQIN